MNQNMPNDENNNQTNEGLRKSVQLFFRGAYVASQEKKHEILNKFLEGKYRDMVERIIDQDNSILVAVNDNYARAVEINETLNKELLNIDSNVSKIKVVQGKKDDFFSQIDSKITEMNMVKTLNSSKIKELQNQLQTLDKKLKTDSEYLKNFSNEKRVWMDKLDAHHLRSLTHKKHFNNSELYDYEYKVFSLIFSGVFLEKVQELTDKELSRKGIAFGWDAMDEEKNEEEVFMRRQKFMERMENVEAVRHMDEEENFNKSEEVFMRELNMRKEAVRTEWRALFKRYWSKTQTAYQNDDEIMKKKAELYYDVTRKTIFTLFQKHCYDAWRFKNMLLDCSEYIVLDYFKSFVVSAADISTTNPQRQEEEVLGYLMNMLDQLKDKAEWLTVHIDDQPEVLACATEKNLPIGLAIVQVNQLRESSEPKKKPVKRVSVDDLSEVFLPALVTIRTIIFLTIGGKRCRTHKEKIDEKKKEIRKKEDENAEIDGQVKLLEEVKTRMKKDNTEESYMKNSNPQVDLDPEVEYKKNVAALSEIRKSLKQIKQLKNDLETNYNNVLKSVAKNLIKPESLEH